MKTHGVAGPEDAEKPNTYEKDWFVLALGLSKGPNLSRVHELFWPGGFRKALAKCETLAFCWPQKPPRGQNIGNHRDFVVPEPSGQKILEAFGFCWSRGLRAASSNGKHAGVAGLEAVGRPAAYENTWF